MRASLLQKLGNLFTEEPEETEEEKLLRLRRHSKLQLLAKSQRNVILDDLEHSIQALQQFVQRQDPSARQQDPKAVKSQSKKNSTGNSNGNTKNQESVVSQAAMMSSTDDVKNLSLTDDLAVVTTVCTNIDRCLSHGLRPVENDDSATVKFFGAAKWTCTRVEAQRQRQMINAMHDANLHSNSKGSAAKRICEVVTSTVGTELPRSVRGFFAAVRAANALANVHSDEGKARAFVRQALNMHLLKDSMKFILADSNADLLASYYNEFALFRQPDDVKMFLELLTGLDQLSFAFRIDDLRLDMSPDILPFSRPLPPPKPTKIKKQAPKLIDPEDMVGGRVHLSHEDDETNLLAEKLVSHHQLGSTFNSHSSGNPLSEILKKAQQTQRLEDAAVAVLRFLEIGYPEYDVFGTELLDVLCNPFLSGMARFDTAMGIPDVVEACICYLHGQLDTPGLFQVHLQPEHVVELRDTIEELGGFHKSMAVDAHEVASILLQYLWELPDPVLTEERRDIFISCIKANASKGERRQVLRVLFNELPWYCKPIMERLLHLMQRALEPVNAQQSGASVYSIAMAFAPLLLRKAHPFRFNEYEDATFRKYPNGYHETASASIRLRLPDSLMDGYPGNAREERDQVAATQRLQTAKQEAEESASLLRLMIEEQNYILQDFRKELAMRREKLQQKVFFLETLRFKMEEPIDLTNDRHVALLKRLWEGLLPADEEPQEECDANSHIENILRSPRWRASGFHTESPLGGFRGGGVLSLECLVYFVHEYPEKAKEMMKRNALPGGNRYPFPVASINVMRMMMKLLMLDETPDVCSKLILHTESGQDFVLKMKIAERVSRSPFWGVFDDPQAFLKLQSMAFMLLDLHWVHSGATQMSFNPVLDSTRRQMGWLLEQAPHNVEEMWTKWMEVREQHASKYSPRDSATSFTSAPLTWLSSFASIKEKDNEDDEQAMLQREDLARQIADNLERKRSEAAKAKQQQEFRRYDHEETEEKEEEEDQEREEADKEEAEFEPVQEMSPVKQASNGSADTDYDEQEVQAHTKGEVQKGLVLMASAESSATMAPVQTIAITDAC